MILTLQLHELMNQFEYINELSRHNFKMILKNNFKIISSWLPDAEKSQWDFTAELYLQFNYIIMNLVNKISNLKILQQSYLHLYFRIFKFRFELNAKKKKTLETKFSWKKL